MFKEEQQTGVSMCRVILHKHSASLWLINGLQTKKLVPLISIETAVLYFFQFVSHLDIKKNLHKE